MSDVRRPSPRTQPPAGPTRRRALHLGSATLITAVAATLADVGSSTVRASARTPHHHRPNGLAGSRVGAHDARTAALLAAHGTPAWARRWHHPISRLGDFTHRSPHTHYARKAIMLTIDDGPSPEWTPKYLALLAHYRVQATFCMIGRQVHPNRHLAKDVLDHGHVIANHTWDHDEALASGSAHHIRSEIERTQHAIHAATGYTPNQFRNPGGAWGSAVYAELVRQRLMPLGWSIDPRDWATPGTGYIERAMLKVKPHEIILCHDGGGNRSETYHALRKVVPALLHRGYTFVTLPRA